MPYISILAAVPFCIEGTAHSLFHSINKQLYLDSTETGTVLTTHSMTFLTDSYLVGSTKWTTFRGQDLKYKKKMKVVNHH